MNAQLHYQVGAYYKLICHSVLDNVCNQVLQLGIVGINLCSTPNSQDNRLLYIQYTNYSALEIYSSSAFNFIAALLNKLTLEVLFVLTLFS